MNICREYEYDDGWRGWGWVGALGWSGGLTGVGVGVGSWGGVGCDGGGVGVGWDWGGGGVADGPMQATALPLKALDALDKNPAKITRTQMPCWSRSFSWQYIVLRCYGYVDNIPQQQRPQHELYRSSWSKINPVRADGQLNTHLIMVICLEMGPHDIGTPYAVQVRCARNPYVVLNTKDAYRRDLKGKSI